MRLEGLLPEEAEEWLRQAEWSPAASTLGTCRGRGTVMKIWFTFPAFIYILCFKKPGDLSFCSNSRVVIPLMKEGLG